MIQSLWLPGWFPARLNDLLRHRAKAARLKRADRRHVAAAAFAHQARPAPGPRRVDLLCVLPAGQRAWDGDSLQKSLLDALVACGLLLDDTPRLCRWGGLSYARALGPLCGSLVTLEDLP